MEKRKLPKIGMRNIKTSIAVAICMFSYSFVRFILTVTATHANAVHRAFDFLVNENTSIYACLAAVIVMRGSVSQSFRSGISRIIGTCIGGLFGMLFLAIGSFSVVKALDFIIVPVGVMLLIYFITLIKENDSTAIAVATFMIIVITVGSNSPHLYAINRILSTAYGVTVSLIVNRFIGKSPSEENTDGSISNNEKKN